MANLSLQRRDMLSMLSGVAAAPLLAVPAWATCRSVLGTAHQLAAEKAFFEVLEDVRIAPLQEQLVAELSRTEIGRTPSGAATVERAVRAWTHSLLFHVLARYRKHPAIIWGTDDTPRRWNGYELPGAGSAGDNPDAVYRTAVLDGTKSYELIGRIDRTNPATQLVIQVDSADATNPGSMFDMNAKKPSIVSATLGLLTDSDLDLDEAGNFRVRIGGDPYGRQHIALRHGVISLGMRDMLSDWRQVPAMLAVREIGVPSLDGPEMLDVVHLRQKLIEALPGFVRFWGGFPNVWFGGLKPNSISEARPRNKGWGYVAGMHFALEDGQAAIVRTGREDAPYTGFQMCDPWMINGDVRAYQLCLNASQVTPDADGSVTYVVSAEDPGAANWIDTEGLSQGLCVIRWQGTTDATVTKNLIQDFRIVPMEEVREMQGLARVSKRQRRVTLAQRAIDYAARTRAAM